MGFFVSFVWFDVKMFVLDTKDLLVALLDVHVIFLKGLRCYQPQGSHDCGIPLLTKSLIYFLLPHFSH